MISPLKLSRVVSLILPDSYSLSRACFFFLAMSYSSFRRLNECFHEINFKTPCRDAVGEEIMLVNMRVYRWVLIAVGVGFGLYFTGAKPRGFVGGYCIKRG